MSDERKGLDGRAWLAAFDSHTGADPVPEPDIDDLADVVREDGSLEEVPALALLDLIQAARKERDEAMDRAMRATQERDRALGDLATARSDLARVTSEPIEFRDKALDRQTLDILETRARSDAHQNKGWSHLDPRDLHMLCEAARKGLDVDPERADLLGECRRLRALVSWMIEHNERHAGAAVEFFDLDEPGRFMFLVCTVGQSETQIAGAVMEALRSLGMEQAGEMRVVGSEAIPTEASEP